MNYWHEKIKIGNLSFPRFIGGPLDGITDSPFRKLVREFSSQELLYSEMRHTGSVANEKGGIKALEFNQLERPLLNYFLCNLSNCSSSISCGRLIILCFSISVFCPRFNFFCISFCISSISS